MDNTLSKSNDLMFNGTLNGDIAAAGELTLGPSADIYGEVRARSLKLSGKVRGTSSSEILVKSSQVPC